jgi:hypothetical protein
MVLDKEPGVRQAAAYGIIQVFQITLAECVIGHDIINGFFFGDRQLTVPNSRLN